MEFYCGLMTKNVLIKKYRPRAAAVAERLWSAPHVRDPINAFDRLLAIQPLWQLRGVEIDITDYSFQQKQVSKN